MNYRYLGKIVSTHGIKGELKLISDFKYKDKIFKKDMNIYIGKDKQKETINTYRIHKQYDMITMNNYDNINEVLKYKNELVYFDEADLILMKNEYLDEELIGFDVIILEKVVGRVSEIINNPKQKIIEVVNQEKKYLIPFVSDIIINIDFIKKAIYVENIKGLIE